MNERPIHERRKEPGFHEYAPDTVNEYEVNVTSFMGERSLGFMNTPHAPDTVNEYEVNVNEYS
jgi:hypothetical protein